MNLKEINDKEYLQNLLVNQEQLYKDIERTDGYVLYLMSKYKIYPSKEVLLKKFNIFSYYFVLKNYELDKKDYKILKPYFSKYENTLCEEVLNDNDIETILKNKEELNANTVLTVNILNDFAQEIEFQKNKSPFLMGNILNQSFSNLSVEEILNLSETVLINNVDLLKNLKNYFSDERFGQLYKKYILKKAKKENEKLFISDFVYYHFKDEDYELLDQLLKNEPSYNILNYDDLSKINGFSRLINKIDFFNIYEHRNIQHFTDSEFKENIDLIRNKWLKEFNKNSKKQNFNSFAQFKVSLPQFKEIMDYDYFCQLVSSNHMPISLNRYDDNYDKNKTNYMYELLLLFISDEKNKKALSQIDLINLHEEFKYITHNTPNSIPKERIDAFYKNVIPFYLKNAYIENILTSYHKTPLFDDFSFPYFKKHITETPSVNAFLILTKKMGIRKQNISSRWENGGITNIWKKIAQYIHPDDVSEICNYFHVENPHVIYKGDENTDKQDNILNYKDFKEEDLKKEKRKFQILILLDLKENFRKFILDKKWELPNNILEEFIDKTIDNGNFKKLKMNEFFKEYIQIHKKNIMADKRVMNILKKQKETEQWFPEFTSNEDEIFKNWIEKIKVFTDGETAEKKQEADELIEKVGQAFFEKKYEIAIKKNNYLEIYYMHNTGRVLFKKVYENISNMNFDDFYQNLKDPYFIKILKSLILNNENYKLYGHDKSNDKNIFYLPHFSDKEKIQSLQILLKEFKEFDNKKGIFDLFAPKDRGFIKNFIIEHLPYDMFYDDEQLMKEPYSAEEIIKGYLNLEKKGGIFSVMGEKDKYTLFLNRNLKGKEEEYLKTLKKAEQIPVLYLILCDQVLMKSFYKKNISNVENKDEFVHDYFLKNFNMDILLKGVEEILDRIKQEQKNEKNKDIRETFYFNTRMAFESVKRLSYHMNYNDGICEKTKESQENMDRYCKTLWQSNPTLLLAIYNIGTDSMSDYIKKYMGTLMLEKPYTVKELIYGPKESKVDYLSTSDFGFGLTVKNNINTYIETMIEYFMSHDQKEEIEYLIYWINQKETLEKVIVFSYGYDNEIIKPSDVFDYLVQEQKLINKLQVIKQKIVLEDQISQGFMKKKKRNKI